MVTGNGPPFDAEEAEKQEIYMLIGQVILISQIAEQALKACMTFVIQDDDPLTLEKLKSQDQQEKRKTLGYFFPNCGEKLRWMSISMDYCRNIWKRETY